MRSTLRQRLGGTLVALVLVLGSTEHASAASFRNQSNPVADQQAFVDAINATRAGVGLPALRVHPALVGVARGWSEKMRQASVAVTSDDCLISHNPDLRNAVSLNWRKLGENVGCGDVGVGGLHTAFVNSPKHYANIVDTTFDFVGIGIVYDGDVMFVTEQFMDFAEAPPTTAAPAALSLSPAKAPAAKVLSAAPVRPKTTPSTKRKRA